MELFIKEVSSPFDETIEHLTRNLADQKFGVLSTISLSDKFLDKGLDFEGRLTILDVCNQIEAFSLYKIDPLAVNFLPCKFVIREINHQVTIEMIRPTDLIALMPNEALLKFSQAVEDKLILATENIK